MAATDGGAAAVGADASVGDEKSDADRVAIRGAAAVGDRTADTYGETVNSSAAVGDSAADTGSTAVGGSSADSAAIGRAEAFQGRAFDAGPNVGAARRSYV